MLNRHANNVSSQGVLTPVHKKRINGRGYWPANTYLKKGYVSGRDVKDNVFDLVPDHTQGSGTQLKATSYHQLIGGSLKKI